MNFDCVITGVSLEDQDYVIFTVDLLDKNSHTVTPLEVAFNVLDLSGTDVIAEVRRAVKKLLAAELDLAQYVGETFEIEPVYRKAFA